MNSRNFTHTSAATREWIAEMNRLFSRCAEASKQGRHPEARAAFDLLFDLMSQVDECRDDIVFFADEGGSWQGMACGPEGGAAGGSQHLP